ESLHLFDLKNYPVHLKINTGMNRLGFTEKDFPTLISFLKTHNEIKVASVFSHLATSDMPEMEKHTQQQLEKFRKWSDFLANELDEPFIRHILNTSGIYNYSAHQYDMVRLGIGLYGVANSKKENEQLLNEIGRASCRVSGVS